MNSHLSNLTILVAEDDKINQLLIGRFLSNKSIKYDIAKNGRVAIEKAKKKAYDLILMDIRMPKMDGYEATKAIRSMPQSHLQDIPIIGLTASISNQEYNKANIAGMDDVLQKSYDTHELYSAITKYTSEQVNVFY